MTVALMAAGVTGSACSRARVSRRSAPAVAVEWAGCASVMAGPRCRLAADRKLTLWTSRADASEWTFSADGRSVQRRPVEAVQDGWRIVLEVPHGAGKVSATLPGHPEPSWGLAVEEPSPPSKIDDLVVAGKRGDADALAQLQNLAEHAPLDRRGPALAGLGRVFLARGQMDKAEPALKAALAADRAEGRLSDEMRDGAALIWGLVVLQQRFADARALLESLRPAGDQFLEGRSRVAYSEGLLAAESNDFRRALSSYRESARSSERLALDDLARSSTEDLGRILNILGRAPEAVAVLEGLAPKQDPCAQATFMINRAEALIEAARQTGEISEARVTATLQEEQRATRVCPDPHRRVVALVDAARYALAKKDEAESAALVARLRQEPEAKDALALAWRADVLGQWSLAHDAAADALKHFDGQAAIARAAGLREEWFRAEVGAGASLLALRRREQAIVRLRTAQTLLEETLDGIPLAEGRTEFLNSHDEAARHLVDALVDGGAFAQGMIVARTTRAAEVARVARLDRVSTLSGQQRRSWDEALEQYARIRQTIEREAAADWALPTEVLAQARAKRQLRADQARAALDSAYRILVDPKSTSWRVPPPPEVGLVELAFFPGAKSWIAFARTSKGVRAVRFRERELDSAEGASGILERLSSDLTGAKRVSVLASGRADRLDWHALAWQGAPLLASMEVEYKLDLPDAPDGARDGHPGRKAALVVSDPTGDLAATGAEAAFVVRALEGWRLTRFDGRAAKRDAVLATLPEVGLFHYAGHATVDGPTGASSALVLSGNERIDLGDLLALARLPALVVLSACRAGSTGASTSAAAPVPGMGLAQAFLAAGVRAVVAPIRDVPDQDARTFVVSLYRSLGSLASPALGPAFRRAAREAVGAGSQSFRLMVH